MSPRQLDESKRLLIAQAALQVLRAKGLQKTTMAEIARVMEMKRPTLYWYFSDVDSIFLWLLEHIHEGLSAHIAVRLAGVGHPLDALIALFEAEHEFFAREGLADFTLLVSQMLSTGNVTSRERFRVQMIQNVVNSRPFLVGMIEQGMAQGVVAECDPEALIDTMHAFFDGTMVHAVLYDGKDTQRLRQFFYRSVIDPLRR